MIVLDLFSGAGGLSEGFWRNGASFVGHVESDHYACDTLRTRAAYWQLVKDEKLEIYNKYLTKEISRDELWLDAKVNDSNEIINEVITDSSFEDIAEKISQNITEKGIQTIDLIIGGPPCQAYSVIGRARMKEKVKDDPRNFLYIYYVKFLEKFKPKMFVFENVPGLKSAGNGEYLRKLKEAVDVAGYHLELKELLASDYGVLQSRRRIIIIGWNKDYYDEFEYPNFETTNLDEVLGEEVKVGALLEDIPFIEPDSLIEGKGKYAKAPNKYLEWSKIRENGFDILTQHETRYHNERDRKIYSLHIDSWFNDKKMLKYNELPSKLQSQKNTKTFLNRFNIVKSDAKFAHTVVAHIAMDGHYYIHPDKKQLRSISVREAARLQSFPDNYYFEGPRTSTFKQIGNAVPPLMAEEIAKQIKKQIEKI